MKYAREAIRYSLWLNVKDDVWSAVSAGAWTRAKDTTGVIVWPKIREYFQ